MSAPPSRAPASPTAAPPSRERTRRLERRPGEVIDRQAPLRFTWNGRPYDAFRGDTIVSALTAAGERVFSRSLKYHRPRGLLTAAWDDPGCMVQVGDEPNVRGSHRRVAAGMAVSAQNAWPSLRFDVKAGNQLVGRFLPAGFYYKTFIRPQRLWPTYEAILRRFAPGGLLPRARPEVTYDQRHVHAEVVVAGGGPAGMSAAVAAARCGARVLLVEEEPELGGHLRFGGPEQRSALQELRAAVAAEAGVEVLVDSVVTGRYDGNWIAVLQRGLPTVTERLVKARAGVLVVAPGLIERPYVFEGNDLPGVVLSGAVRRLVNLYAVRPGERAVVLSANPQGDAAVADLEAAGVEVAAVVDPRRGCDVLRARGGRELRRVELTDGTALDCDLLVTAVGWTAPTGLLNMAGDRPRYSERAARFLPGGSLPPEVLVAGGLAGDGSLERMVEHARAVGTLAAARAGRGPGEGACGGSAPGAAPELPLDEHPALFRGRTHGIVDFSEDVGSRDLVAAAREGYDSIELLKRFTTVTMGPTQGKLETMNAVAVLAEATGRTIEETGTTVWRPPTVPVSLGALAGRMLEPVRRSPLQAWHEAHGAHPLVAGQWVRPEHYGDPAAEVRLVRQRVGIIDVTPLGKLGLHGPDVARLLELVYVNRWAGLVVGGVRYGVMCAEDGVVMDDGVTGRLAPDRWLMSTTSSGAETVERWLEHLLQVDRPHWRVHVVPLTGALASINVAGPESRRLLARLVDDVDLRPEAFPYMRVREGTVAGVPHCLMWRIGFTGELSYELHVPAAHGLHVWETLLAAGADLGIGPFGVEAQRILRLEKGHLIVGQDTDGLTKAHGLGLDSLIRLDKDDFVGRPELAWQRDDPSHPRLVALQPLDGAVVPPEASQIVVGEATIAGRVTSSRMSPTLGRSVCLGVVAAHLATPGTVVTVLLPEGGRIPVVVTAHHAHFDPEGTRVRG